MLLIRSLLFLVRGVSPLRLFGPLTTLVGLLVLAFCLATGRINFSQFDLPSDTAAELVSTEALALPATAPHAPAGLGQAAVRPPERIRIATFNIQRFGEKKSANAEVMNHLARIIANFDLVAIQEVQSPQAMPVPRLVERINRGGGRYEASLSEPIGHTTYREQYAFVWDAARIRMLPDSAYVVRDNPPPNHRLHRPPMVASFEARIQPVAGRQPFRFTVINAHTDPENVTTSSTLNELDVLDDVFLRVRDYEYQTRRIMNVLLLGDLNVGSNNLGQLGQLPGLISVVGNTPTNTAGTKTYDHILLDRNITTEYTGVFGVVDYQQDYGLTAEQAKLVSDHRPVWAEFSAYEMPPLSAAAAGNAAHGTAVR